MIHFDRQTLPQKISEYIAGQIVEGKLKPGEKLLEGELGEIFGTSRAPIRESFFILENQGIVERIPRVGVFVKEYSQKEILDFYTVVYELTEVALKNGIEKITKKQINELLHIIEKLELSIQNEDLKEGFLMIEQLHSTFFELADNSTLKDVYERLNKRWTTFRYLTLSYPDSLKNSSAEYRKIIEGLKDNNLAWALEVLRMKEKRAREVLGKIIPPKE